MTATDLTSSDECDRWPGLVARPLRDDYDTEKAIREACSDDPGGRTESTVQLYGHCQSFCLGEGPTSGQSVREHSPWCGSSIVVWVAGRNGDGDAVQLYGGLVAPYYHGVYRKEDMPLVLERFLSLRIAGPGFADPNGILGDEESVFLDAGEVRRMAAALVRAADAMDMLDVDINDALTKRKRDR